MSHEFLPALTEKLAEGVPGGCRATPPACIAGPLSGVNALAIDPGTGHLWVAERLQGAAGKNLGKSRVDAFDDSSGAFVPEQRGEEGGVEHLEGAVAVGHAGGEEQEYVGAGFTGHNVLAVFGPSGRLQAEGVWSGNDTPQKSFHSLRGVAVDHSPNLETQGDLYVASSNFTSENVIDVFAGEAGGKEPASVIGQLSGTCEAEGEALPCAGSKLIPFGEVRGVAVSPVNGDVLVADGATACAEGKGKCLVDVFEPAGGLPGVYNFLFSIEGAPGEPFKFIGPMAVDGSGDIYVVEELAKLVDQFGPEGRFVTRLTGTPAGAFKGPLSVAADAASGRIYVGDFDVVQQTGVVDAFGPSVIVPDVTTSTPSVRVTLGAGGEGEIEATLSGTVDPLGQGAATCAFPWGVSKAFGQLAPCAGGVPEGSGPVAVKATLKALAPDSSYFFRLQASNKNGTNPGEVSDDKELVTPGPGIHSVSAADVAASSATLAASIAPDGAPTSYYFQYGTSAAYGSQAPAVPGALGSGSGDVQATPQHLQGLSPGTVYHYRVVAVSQLEVEGKTTAVPFLGADQTFTTQGAGGAAGLLDGRHWELVSPTNKHGAQLLASDEGGVLQASASGGAITYIATVPTEEGVKGSIYAGVQVLSTRGASGWSSQDIPLAHATPTPLPAGNGLEYRYFSEDLSSSLVEPLAGFDPLSGEAFPPVSERTPVVRHNLTCGSSPATCFTPLVTGAAGYANVPAGTKFGGPNKYPEPPFGEVHFVGATTDLAHTIVGSHVPLTAVATGAQEELYEITPGSPAGEQIQLVSLRAPNEKGEELPAEGASLGFGDKIARDAVSEDGSRVTWRDENGHLYMRDLAMGQTAQLDLPEAACIEEGCGGGTAGARYQLASPDGSRVLFTDTQRLTKDAPRVGETANLYECEIVEVAGRLSCRLTDLTPSPGAGHRAEVQGAVIGASEDGSWVYFVANGLLGDASAQGASAGDCRANVNTGEVEGQCGLYVYHEGATHLIATVAGADEADWGGGSAGRALTFLSAQVSPDGHYLAFMSQRPLTGYDTTDVISGQPDEEVYLYHAQSSAHGNLVCASCNPSGARPHGVEYGQLELTAHLVAGAKVWPPQEWIAANIPGWTAYEQAHALFQPRYLSDSGRLFFNTDDSLVAQDINNNQDVYEYEPATVGDCSGEAKTFQPPTGGCLALISSGRAAGPSGFVDASQTGDDVFFMTTERLVPGDTDSALDLYDAHACTTGSPCPEEPASPPACVTTDSCRAAPTPQPPIFGSPSSATFTGQGNLAPTPPIKPAAVKPTRAQLLAKALVACKKEKGKMRRVSCERLARSRYGAKKRSTKAMRRKK